MADFTFVNQWGTFPGASSPAFVATAGNLIVVSCRYNDSPTGLKFITGMNDTAGNTYLDAGVRVNDGVNDLLEIWYCIGCLGHATNVVTVSFNATPNFIAVNGGQWSYVTTPVLDVATTFSTPVLGVNPVSSFPFTTTAPSSLIIAAAQVAATGSTWSIPSGVLTAIRGSDPSTVMALADAIVTSIQTSAVATLSSTNTTSKSIVVVSFKVPFTPSAEYFSVELQ